MRFWDSVLEVGSCFSDWISSIMFSRYLRSQRQYTFAHSLLQLNRAHFSAWPDSSACWLLDMVRRIFLSWFQSRICLMRLQKMRGSYFRFFLVTMGATAVRYTKSCFDPISRRRCSFDYRALLQLRRRCVDYREDVGVTASIAQKIAMLTECFWYWKRYINSWRLWHLVFGFRNLVRDLELIVGIGNSV